MGHAGQNRWVYDLFNGSATPDSRSIAEEDGIW